MMPKKKAKKKVPKGTSKEVKEPLPYLFPVNLDPDHAFQILAGLRCNYPDHRITMSRDFQLWFLTDVFGVDHVVSSTIVFPAFMQTPDINPLMCAHCIEWVNDHIGPPKFGWKLNEPEPLKLDL